MAAGLGVASLKEASQDGFAHSCSMYVQLHDGNRKSTTHDVEDLLLARTVHCRLRQGSWPGSFPQ